MAQSVDTLQLNDEEEYNEDYTLHREGHEEAPHPRLQHGEVVCLVCYVWNHSNNRVILICPFQ